MVFDGRWFADFSGGCISRDSFREVELSVGFRRLTCYRCGFEGFYRYHVQQVRRRGEIQISSDEEIRADHLEIWKGIPRFAEIPETVKCKNCREVLGLYTFCLF